MIYLVIHDFGKNKKVIGKFEIEFPENIWIDEFVCLRRKRYALTCGSDSENAFKGTSQFQSEK